MSSSAKGEVSTHSVIQPKIDIVSEYVALEKLEGVYSLNPLFASLLIHADSTRSHLVVLGVADPLVAVSLVETTTGQKFAPADIALLEQAVQDKRVRKAVVQALTKVGKEHKMNG